jgi:hypothetical protein
MSLDGYYYKNSELITWKKYFKSVHPKLKAPSNDLPCQSCGKYPCNFVLVSIYKEGKVSRIRGVIQDFCSEECYNLFLLSNL